MSRLRVPDPIAGLNRFATAPWWSGLEQPDRLSRDGAATLVTVDAEAPEITLLVAGAVGGLLAEPTPEAVTAWVSQVRALAGEAAGAVHLAIALEPIGSLEQVETLARGHRWPGPDLRSGARHQRTDPIPAPTTPGGLSAISSYVDALLGQVEVLLDPGWLTAADAAADATACLIRSLDADPDLAEDEARALRGACRAAVGELGASGITISGPRDALLWPVNVIGGAIPIDVAADAAVEVLLGQLERPVVLDAQPRPVPLAEQPARALLRHLRGAR